jgi:hypothetical protein
MAGLAGFCGSEFIREGPAQALIMCRPEHRIANKFASTVWVQGKPTAQFTVAHVPVAPV